MLKLIATWVSSIKTEVIWSQPLPVMRGSLPVSYLYFLSGLASKVYLCWSFVAADVLLCCFRCLAVSPNFEIAKNNMAIALTDLGTKVVLPSY